MCTIHDILFSSNLKYHCFFQLNTFQVVVTTDGLFSFAIFNYAKIEWVTGDASDGDDGFGGTPAMVGINVGDGVRSIKYNHSLTDEVVRVVNASNVGVPGQLVYRIDDDVSNSTETGFFSPYFLINVIQVIFIDL